jgi:hypothetical protein
MLVFILIAYTVLFLLLTKDSTNKSNSVDRILQIKEYELIRDAINDSKK